MVISEFNPTKHKSTYQQQKGKNNTYIKIPRWITLPFSYINRTLQLINFRQWAWAISNFITARQQHISTHTKRAAEKKKTYLVQGAGSLSHLTNKYLQTLQPCHSTELLHEPKSLEQKSICRPHLINTKATIRSILLVFHFCASISLFYKLHRNALQTPVHKKNAFPCAT